MPAPTKAAVGGRVVTPQGYGRRTAPGYSAGVEERYESELAQSASVLDDVDRALERLTAGAYNSCEDCGAPIADADLALDPTRRRCAAHAAGPAPAEASFD
jgi:hypothetical protein